MPCRRLPETFAAVTAAAYLHKMRGAAASLALPTVAAITGEIEEALQGAGDALDLLGTLQVALHETLADIAEYTGEQAEEAVAEEAPVVTAPAQSAELQRHLHALLQALDSDDPLQIEAALPALRPWVPANWLQALSLRVEEFDFRGAESLVRQHLSDLEALPSTG